MSAIVQQLKHLLTMSGVRCNLDRVLFGPWVVCMAGCIFALSVLGCMNLNFGGVKLAATCEETDLLVQEGKIPVRPRGDQVIYYPVAFAAPPNLELEDPAGLCDIVDQKDICFTIRFHTTSAASQQPLSWKARGQRVPQPTIPSASPSAETVPAATLPSNPTPNPTLAQPR